MVREVMDEAGEVMDIAVDVMYMDEEVMDMANYRRQGISFISMVAESFVETSTLQSW